MEQLSASPSDFPDRSVLKRYLQRLDRRSFAALVCDIYREQGWEASIENGFVVATDRSSGHEEIVVPHVETWLNRSDSVTLNRQVDVVVTTGDGTGQVGKQAARLDATCRTIDEVIDRLLYAIDREAAATICREHIGIAPTAMRPPLRRRLQKTLTTRTGTIATVGMMLIIAGLLTVGPNGVLPTDDPSTGSEIRTVPEPESRIQSALNQNSVRRADDAMTSLRPLTTADIRTLAAIHQRTLNDRPFRRTRQYTGPATNETGPVIRQQVKVIGRETFRIRTTASGPSIQTARELYYDGRILYEARFENRSFTYQVVTINDQLFDSEMSAGTDTIIQRYLTTPNVTMTGPYLTEDGKRYRVRARGAPSALDSTTVWNYTASAVVTPQGMVERLSVAFEQQRGGDDDVMIVFEYKIGTGEPTPPRWYQQRWGESIPTATETDGS